jgi:hypothetical protein
MHTLRALPRSVLRFRYPVGHSENIYVITIGCAKPIVDRNTKVI